MTPDFELTSGSGYSGYNINHLSTDGTTAATSITTTQITFTITYGSTTTADTILFQSIEVRPSATTPLASGNIVDDSSATATINGSTKGSTNWGTLTKVVGTATKLAFNQQPTGATAGRRSVRR